MAQGNDKPNLSDLKSRLGLQKSTDAQPDEPSDDADGQPPSAGQTRPDPAPQQQQARAGQSATPPSADGPGPSSSPAARPGASRPPAASGPPAGSGSPAATAPPAAAPPPAGRPAQSAGRQSGSAQMSAEAVEARRKERRKAFDDIELDDEDLAAAGDSTFSPMVMVLFVILLGVGIGFGWLAAGTMSAREASAARSNDAQRIHKALKPKIANLEQVQKIVGGLSGDKVDFKAANKLAKLEVAPDGNLLGGNRLLLGTRIIDNLTAYTTDALMLEQMLDEHKRLTTQVDKKELEQLMKNNKVLKEDRFAVIFDYRHLAKNSGSANYVPRKARLVTVESLKKDDDGKVGVKMLNSDETIKTRLQGILPLDKGDILDSGGQNALQRYKVRVARIKRLMKEFAKTKDPLMNQLQAVATKDDA